MLYYEQQGECPSSISARYGLSWQTVWNHPENAELKRKREDPNFRYPGDALYIPERAVREESRSTEAKHRFQKKNTPVKLKLLLDDRPRSGKSYRLYVDAALVAMGQTDRQGFLEAKVPATAQEAHLYVADGTGEDCYILRLGEIDPIDTESGLQQRLTNLGFATQDDLQAAFRAFQQQVGLNATGVADQQTRAKLQERYGL